MHGWGSDENQWLPADVLTVGWQVDVRVDGQQVVALSLRSVLGRELPGRDEDLLTDLYWDLLLFCVCHRMMRTLCVIIELRRLLSKSQLKIQHIFR